MSKFKVFLQVLWENVKRNRLSWTGISVIMAVGYFYTTRFWLEENWSRSSQLGLIVAGVATMAIAGFMVGLTLFNEVLPDTWIIWRAKQKAPLQFL